MRQAAPGGSGRRGDERRLPQERPDPRAGVSRRVRRRQHAAIRGRRADRAADHVEEPGSAARAGGRPARVHDRGAAAAAARGTAWAGAVWLTGDGNPDAAGRRAARAAARYRRSTVPVCPRARRCRSAGPDAIAAADLNYDFRTDLVVAGPGGLQIFRQNADAHVLAGDGRGAAARTASPARRSHAVWPADIDTDGDLDLDPRHPRRRAGGAAQQQRRHVRGAVSLRHRVARARLCLGRSRRRRRARRGAARRPGRAARVPQPARRRVPSSARCRASSHASAAIAAAEVSGDGIVDVLGVAADGSVTRLSTRADGSGFEAARLAQADPPPGLAPGTARLLVADLDNNGAGDLVISSPAASRVLLAEPGGALCDARCAMRDVRRVRANRGFRRDHDRRGSGRRRPARARGARRRRRPRRAGERPEAVPLAGDSHPRGHGDRRSAHQLVRHRRRDRSAHRPARAEAGHRRAGRRTSAWARRPSPRSRASSGRTASCSRSSISPRTRRSARASG